MKFFKLVPLLLFIFLFVQIQIPVAAPLKIGVVDLNHALNGSEEGMRSKNLLESEGRQKQQELKLEQEDLRKQVEELRNNVLLKKDARQQKEGELRNKEQSLVQKSRKFEQDLRKKERQITSEIFKELKAVIRTVAKKGTYDLILEKTASEVILYMNNETTDLTNEVIDHYNSIKTPSKQ
ncbi:MAG: OmpH family outer membrane protein [SAR324 cluster bacterium]|nr:OmpH family outer membrane protein [SAR324 cluster bacterium]